MVIVRGTIDVALQILAKKKLVDGIERALKIHDIPKRSERKKLKRFLAERRRVRNQARNEGRRAGASSK